MAILPIGATNFKFIGLSSDDKSPSDYVEGAELHLVDTGEELILHDGMWELDRRLIRALQTAFV